MTEIVSARDVFADERFAFIPSLVRYPKLYNMYNDQIRQFWTIAVLKPSSDIPDWEALKEPEQTFIKNILGFFAGSDKIVMDNLRESFMPDIKLLEAQLFWGAQMMIEAIHSETYGLIIDIIIKNMDEKRRLGDAIQQIPAVRSKALWAQQWSEKKDNGEFKHSLEERLIAYIIVEGLFFSGSFCAVFWLKNRGIMLNGLCKSNDLISKDEGLHTKFTTELYNMLPSNLRLPQSRIYEIFDDALAIETDFICQSLKCDLIGMNKELMKSYLQFTADKLISSLGYNTKFGIKSNPCKFADMLGMASKENSFETTSINYQMAGVGKRNEFRLDADV